MFIEESTERENRDTGIQMEDHREKVAIHKPRKQASGEIRLTNDTLRSDFQSQAL